MKVTHLIMGGSSQTGERHPRLHPCTRSAGARMPDGSPVFDGYFPTLAGGTEPVSGGDAAVVHVLGEGDIMGGGRPATADPTATNPTTASASSRSSPRPRAHAGLESAAEIFPLLADADPASGELSQFPAAMPYMAAMHNLIEWVTNGIEHPKAAASRPTRAAKSSGMSTAIHTAGCG